MRPLPVASTCRQCVSAPVKPLQQRQPQSRRHRRVNARSRDPPSIAAAAAMPPSTSSSSSSSSSSLIPDTLAGMQQDEDFLRAAAALKAKGQAALTREEAAARRRSLAKLGLPPFAEAIKRAAAAAEAAAGAVAGGGSPSPSLARSRADTLQLNVGLFCNQACAHCHVESSPLRKEEAMSPATARRCLELAARALETPSSSPSPPPPALRTLDLTGGAPELHEVFRELVVGGRALGLEVVDRCNLTVLTEPGQGMELAQFLADNGVRDASGGRAGAASGSWARGHWDRRQCKVSHFMHSHLPMALRYSGGGCCPARTCTWSKCFTTPSTESQQKPDGLHCSNGQRKPTPLCTGCAPFAQSEASASMSAGASGKSMSEPSSTTNTSNAA